MAIGDLTQTWVTSGPRATYDPRTFFRFSIKIFNLLNHVKFQLFLRKLKAKTSFSLNLTLKFNPYVTNTVPRRLNVLLMWPATQKELPTPDITHIYSERKIY